MHLLHALFALALPTFSHTGAAADVTKPREESCSLHSSSSGSFYDLSPLKLVPVPRKTDDNYGKVKGANESWVARGHDYGHNFTLNICGPVVEELKDVKGLPKNVWANVSAFYENSQGNIISMGMANDKPIFRGRKIVLNYTQGSPCPDLDEFGDPLEKREIVGGHDDDDDDDDEPPRKKPGSGSGGKGKTVNRRRSTLLSFICDTSPNLSSRPSISFLGPLDHCTYVFEVRSRWACAGATPPRDSGTLGPGGVFGVIVVITIAVYLIGGVVYQRNVMHQRGWRQLPNYSVWAGLFSFFQDMFIILFSACTRCVPSLGRLFGGKRGGYHRVGSDYRSNGSIGRGRSSEDANRLIDSLDEEWD